MFLIIFRRYYLKRVLMSLMDRELSRIAQGGDDINRAYGQGSVHMLGDVFHCIGHPEITEFLEAYRDKRCRELGIKHIED